MFTLDMPGALADYVADSAEQCGGAVFAAYRSATRITRGRGYTLRITSTSQVIDFFTDHAETVLALAGPGAEFSRSEVDAARAWLKRVEAVGL